MNGRLPGSAGDGSIEVLDFREDLPVLLAQRGCQGTKSSMGVRLFCQSVLIPVIALISSVSIDPVPASASSEWDHVSSLVDHCRAAMRAAAAAARAGARTALSEDRATLCFDGAIMADEDIGIVDRLRQDGFFIVRSSGGYAAEAIRMSDKLRERNARVIVYDYCLSACANYVLVASHKTYVTKGAIVAWHGGPPNVTCDAAFVSALRERYRERSHSPQQAEAHCETARALRRASREFFRRRAIGERHTYDPQNAYTKKYVNLYRRGRLYGRDVFWMWNPKNHRGYFGSIVEYESYPRSQDEVDALRAQWVRGGLGVIFDPALDP
jgi:hypothetical protein